MNAAQPKPEPNAAETKRDAKAARPKHDLRNKTIFTLSITGLLAALVGACLFARERKAQPPVFKPVTNPYGSAIYANGIIESDQSSGENINIYPEVSGPITKVLVREGQQVSAGTPLFTIDDSVQRPTTEQLRSQSEASLALLEELKAQPRKETLAIALAQVGLAEANLKAARDQYDKDRASYDFDPKSISKNALDTAQDAVSQAAAALDVAQKQYELTKAGAWSYDIDNQERQYQALKQAYQAANALLVKYSVKAPVDGIVLAVNAAAGSYVSSQGAYDPYTELLGPLVIMGPRQDYLAVRCYVDEILVSRLPSPPHIRAQMSIRGSYTNQVPLEFVRVQPYVSPKIGVATANLFPSFSLNGAYGAASMGSFSVLSAASGRFWSLGPSASIPVFQGTTFWYGRRAAIDAYQQSQAVYRQTVLGAFEQVADALKALEHDAEALQAQVEARRAAREALDLVQVNYRAGLAAYLDVLTADVQFHQATIAYLQAVAQRHQDTVALFVALGGGWWNEQHPRGKGEAP